MKFEFLYIVISGKTCEKTKIEIQKSGQREFSQFIWLSKTLCFFPSTKADKALGI